MLIALAPLPAAAQDDMLARVNGLRASVGVYPYTYNGALSAAAQSQAQWMVDNATISHTRPDGSGPRTRAAAAGYGSALVSENIYGGTNATPDSAWTFWINSGVHYAGLVSTNYNEIGIGSARGSWGATYVLVFGNSGGASLAAAPAAASAGGTSSGSGGGGGAQAAPPSFVLGVDAAGNIQHQVQPGDTLGDIALLYGYTWDDLPYMMQVNNMGNVRDLVPGSVFLVPPRAGTFTPTPDNSTPVPTNTLTPVPATITPFVLPTRTPPLVTLAPFIAAAPTVTEGLAPQLIGQTIVVTPSATRPASDSAALSATADSATIVATPSGQPTELALRTAEAAPPSDSGASGPSTWLIAALAVQAVIVIGAGVEFIRRAGRGGRKDRP